MDTYRSIEPLRLFWKYTSVTNFVYSEEKGVLEPKINFRLRIAVITIICLCIATTAIAVFSIHDNSPLGILKEIYFFALTYGLLISLIKTWRNNTKLVICLSEMVNLDNVLIPRNKLHTRKFVIVILTVYSIVCMFLFLCEIYGATEFYSTSFEGISSIIHYYIFYLFNASTSCLILFFLNELVTRFRIVNFTFMPKTKSQVSIRHLRSVCEVHRELRHTSRCISKIFQEILLGKVLSTVAIITANVFACFTQWQKIVSNSDLISLIWLMWGIGHYMEIVAIVYYFSAVRSEVSFILLSKINICRSFNIFTKS